jgi:uncharacterized protein (DUF4415 family)
MPRKTDPVIERDNPEWTKADFAKAKRFPKGTSLAAATKELTRGRPKLANPKEAIKLRLDADVMASYRETGPGWQTRINKDLRKARKLKAS